MYAIFLDWLEHKTHNTENNNTARAFYLSEKVGKRHKMKSIRNKCL